MTPPPRELMRTHQVEAENARLRRELEAAQSKHLRANVWECAGTV